MQDNLLNQHMCLQSRPRVGWSTGNTNRRELLNKVLLAMQEKLDWTQTNITVDIAIRKDGVPGTVLNLSCAVILFLGSSRPMLILSLDYYILTSVAYSSLKLFSCRQLVDTVPIGTRTQSLLPWSTSSLCTPGATLRSVTGR